MHEHVVFEHTWMKWVTLALMLIGVSLGCLASAGGLDEALDAITKGDLVTGTTLLKPLAHKGNPEAQYLLGRAYGHGEGVDPDPVKAIKWLESAADQLHYSAANTLGKMYASGRGVKMNTELAAKWFTRAAEIAEATDEEHEDCDD